MHYLRFFGKSCLLSAVKDDSLSDRFRQYSKKTMNITFSDIRLDLHVKFDHQLHCGQACRGHTRHTSLPSSSLLDSHDNDASIAVAAARRAWYDQRRAYRHLRHQKCSAFWSQKVESERAQPAKLWQSVDQLLGCGRVPMTSSIDVETINKFFVDKVDNVRASVYRQRVATDVHSRLCRNLIARVLYTVCR